MARSRTGRRAFEGKIRSLSEGRVQEARKRKPIPEGTQQAILTIMQNSQRAQAAIKSEWDAYLAGVRTALGVPDGWVLDRDDGGDICFAEPPVIPPAPAPAETEAKEQAAV